MALLTIALFVDALVNIVRIIEVERGMKMQARWLSNRDKELAEVIAALTARPEAEGGAAGWADRMVCRSRDEIREGEVMPDPDKMRKALESVLALRSSGKLWAECQDEWDRLCTEMIPEALASRQSEPGTVEEDESFDAAHSLQCQIYDVLKLGEEPTGKAVQGRILALIAAAMRKREEALEAKFARKWDDQPRAEVEASEGNGWDDVDDAFDKMAESFADVECERYERTAFRRGGSFMKHLVRKFILARTPRGDSKMPQHTVAWQQARAEAAEAERDRLREFLRWADGALVPRAEPFQLQPRGSLRAQR